MKKLKFALVSGWLLILTSSLIAQNTGGRFNLKEGDWFEMKFGLPMNFTDKNTSPVNFFKEPVKSEITGLLRYQLLNQYSNGNQVFNVSIKRIQSKVFASNFNVWLGYDSYYPPYEDNMKSAKEFLQFEMEVKPDGSITRFDSISGYTPTVKLSEISAGKNIRLNISIGLNFPTQFIKLFSSFVAFLPPKSGSKTLFESKIETDNYSETESYAVYKITSDDSISSEIRCLKKEKVLVSTEFAKLLNASFPIPANTMIKGKLVEQSKQDITISLEGDNKESYFAKKTFKTNEDGSFNCPIFLNTPFYLNINIGNKRVSSFIEPMDTLEILEISRKVERVSEGATFYDISTKPGYLLSSANFKGKAAYNAKLSVEMDEWMGYTPMPKNVQAYLDYRKVITQNISELIHQYSGKASETCIDYFRTKWDYYLAYDKLYFHDATGRMLIKEISSISKFVKDTIEYPTDFFLEVDTLSTLMTNYPWCRYYKAYIGDAYIFRKNRLGMVIGGLENDFYANYYFSRASLKGFPQYSAIAKAIDLELRKGFVSASRIEPFYQDFMNNCNDPLLTDPLTKVHEIVSNLAIGNTFPVQSFILKDSTIFDLQNYKGKPVCLVVMRQEKKWIDYYKKEMDKFNPSEVEFVFISLPNIYSDKSSPSDSILAMPNVKVIDVVEQDLESKLLKAGNNKIFMLDKWLRIVDDEVKDPLNHFGSDDFEKAVKKAIQAKRYSKAQKTTFYKNAGWSFGSILFTLLIGLWIYKIRIRRLKEQESVKRRIKELEIKAIRSQMNPHFIFNALNSIQSLINSNQFKEANIYLSKFAVLLRGVLNNSEKSMVSLSDELQAVELYCQLEQLRFEFQFEINISSEVNGALIEIPGMIIQPLTENAIVHGLASKGVQGKLNIRIERQNGDLCICVSDNGVGLSSQKSDELSQKGFGLKLVEERIKILNLDGKQAKLTVEHNAESTGTIATLTIPID